VLHLIKMWLDCPARASRRGRSAVGEIETRSADDARQTPPRAALHLHTPFASYPLLTLLRIQPIAPTRRKNPFNDPDWLFDVKYDGFRGLCYVEHGRNRLIFNPGDEPDHSRREIADARPRRTAAREPGGRFGGDRD
jgi:hypothetical protein